MFQGRLFFSPAVVPGGIAPESLTFTPLDDMIFLKWEEPVEPNGLITQYEVGYLVRHAKNKIHSDTAASISHTNLLQVYDVIFPLPISVLFILLHHNDPNEGKVSLLTLQTVLLPFSDFPRLVFFSVSCPNAGSNHEPEPLEWGGPTFHSSWDLLYMFIW